MTERQKRREQRLKNIKVEKTSLHSNDNHSFCLDLSPLEAWELLAKISKEMWFIQTGQIAPTRVDKSQVRILTREML